jgi:signal transduction histidine kinase
VHPDDRGWVDSLWRKTLAKRMPAEAEYRMRDKDGIYHWFLSRAEPLFDANHNLQSYIGTCTNIDEVKKVQQDLALARQRMEDFIKMASHELKTPLATLKGYLQLILRGTKDEERQLSPLLIKSSAVNMEKQVNRLTRLVAELLDVSRIEAGQLELNKEFFSLNELVIEMVQDMLYIDNRVSIHVSHEIECKVYADKDRIGQVLTNLLTNAIKYSPGNKKIEVTIHCNNANQAAVCVKDRGIGISKEDQQKIFQRFYRAEVFGKPYPGFGIGLYIAYEIIHRHGGSIYVESEKGKGASFTFTLPIDNRDSLPN